MMNYMKMRKYDTSQWDGINSTIFFSGCKFRCPGCFNKDAWDFDSGFEFTKTEQDLFIKWANDQYVDGVCILGGEPFHQDLNELRSFIERLVLEVNKPIHIWSGYTFNELIQDKKKLDILEMCDTLVDGRFILEKKQLNLKYRGSTNQRVIELQRHL